MKNTARVQSCPDIKILNSLFGLCQFFVVVLLSTFFLLILNWLWFWLNAGDDWMLKLVWVGFSPFVERLFLSIGWETLQMKIVKTVFSSRHFLTCTFDIWRLSWKYILVLYSLLDQGPQLVSAWQISFNFFQIWSSLYLGHFSPPVLEIRLGSKTMKCQLCQRKMPKWAISYRRTLYLYLKKIWLWAKLFTYWW